MKFLDGYIIATIITGVLALLNHLDVYEISTIWVLSPVIIYLTLSIVVSITKEITKTKG